MCLYAQISQRPYLDRATNALELFLLSNALIGYVAAVGAEVSAESGPSGGGGASGLGRLVDAMRFAGTVAVGAVLVKTYGGVAWTRWCVQSSAPSESNDQLCEQLLSSTAEVVGSGSGPVAAV